MRSSMLLALIVATATACSSEKTSPAPGGSSPPSSTDGGDGGGSTPPGEDTFCDGYGSALEALPCVDSQAAEGLAAVCAEVSKSESCLDEYEAVLECQKGTASCQDDGLVFAACEDESDAYNECKNGGE